MVHAGASGTVTTIGYEGRSLADLIAALSGAGVTRVVDLRENPWSRKPGFSGKQLAAALAESGIAYSHLPELGTPKAVRLQRRSDGDQAAFAAAYREHLASQPEALRAVRELARRERVALLCFERDAAICHRSMVAEALGADGFAVEHL